MQKTIIYTTKYANKKLQLKDPVMKIQNDDMLKLQECIYYDKGKE